MEVILNLKLFKNCSSKLVIIFLSLQFYLKKHDVILKVNQDIKASNIDKSTNP